MTIYPDCSTCFGKGTVTRELPDHTMNGGGFADFEVECPECRGEGWVIVEVEQPERISMGYLIFDANNERISEEPFEDEREAYRHKRVLEQHAREAGLALPLQVKSLKTFHAEMDQLRKVEDLEKDAA